MSINMELLRVAIGTALVQSGYYDQEGNGDTELLGRRPCKSVGEKNCIGDNCKGCSGVPYLSDAIAAHLDDFGFLSRAVSQPLPTDVVEKVARALYESHWRHDAEFPDDPALSCDPWEELDEAAREDWRTRWATTALEASGLNQVNKALRVLRGFYDYVRISLCDLCAKDTCSLHQPAEGIILAVLEAELPVTKAGTALTPDVERALAAEAEAGFAESRLVARRKVQP